ncbi:MAG: hypothetical protein C0516_07115 [Gemmatimonas sp.]|uniref:DUF6933 domain-containing protein n=1 Tax=Gemmatimonas sp. UBA7669 TaxID=1946568 RepID=UPI0031CD761F|nr:hypothetical protein [Gemmatimonas sp.]
MLILRCTKPLLAKLAKHIPSASGESTASTTRLGDWYAKHLNIGRHRLILSTNEETFLSVVVPAKDMPALPARINEAVGHVLRFIGVPELTVENELREMHEVRVGPTASRRVLGYMNDHAYQVEAMVDYGGGTFDLANLAERLSTVPCGTMDFKSPARLARELLGVHE